MLGLGNSIGETKSFYPNDASNLVLWLKNYIDVAVAQWSPSFDIVMLPVSVRSVTKKQSSKDRRSMVVVGFVGRRRTDAVQSSQMATKPLKARNPARLKIQT